MVANGRLGSGISQRPPAATAKEVEAAIHELDADLNHSVIELSPHTYVVAANRVEIGTFFIVSRDSEVYHSAWNVKDFARLMTAGTTISPIGATTVKVRSLEKLGTL